MSSISYKAYAGILGGLLAVGVLAACAPDSEVKTVSDTASPSISKPAKGTAKKTTTAKPEAGMTIEVPGDGTYKVGKEITPGQYRSGGPADKSLGICTWEIKKDTTGDLSATDRSDILTGTGYVTIKVTDKYFTTTGCKPWKKV